MHYSHLRQMLTFAALEKAVEEAEKIIVKDYKDTSDFESALAAAKLLLEGKEAKKELKHTEVATATDTLVEKQKALKPVDPNPVDPDPVDPNPVDPDPVDPGKPSTPDNSNGAGQTTGSGKPSADQKNPAMGTKKSGKAQKPGRYNSGCTDGRRGTGLCNDASCKFSQKRKKTIEMKE